MTPIVRTLLLAGYLVLFIAATGRSSIQLATKASEAPVPYTLSAVAAVIYGVIALALWKRWHGLALVLAGIELVGVIAVSLIELLASQPWPDHTVWTEFGIGYGFAPIFLPALALRSLVMERIRARRGAGAQPQD